MSQDGYMCLVYRLYIAGLLSGLTPAQAIARYRLDLDLQALDLMTRSQSWSMMNRTMDPTNVTREHHETIRDINRVMCELLPERLRALRIYFAMWGEDLTWAQYCDRFILAEAQGS